MKQKFRYSSNMSVKTSFVFPYLIFPGVKGHLSLDEIKRGKLKIIRKLGPNIDISSISFFFQKHFSFVFRGSEMLDSFILSRGVKC